MMPTQDFSFSSSWSGAGGGNRHGGVGSGGTGIRFQHNWEEEPVPATWQSPRPAVVPHLDAIHVDGVQGLPPQPHRHQDDDGAALPRHRLLGIPLHQAGDVPFVNCQKKRKKQTKKKS